MASILNSIQKLRSVAQFRSFDTTTPSGQSSERYRRALFTTAASVFSKMVSSGTALISVPLTLHYLGTERYGLWMTISSLIAILGFSDLGITNGLLNGIAKAHGNEDRELALKYVSSAFFFLTLISVILLTAFAIAYPWISWSSFFRVSTAQAMAEAGPAAAAFVACFLAGIPMGLVAKIQTGYQEGFTANLWSSAGSILALTVILAVIHIHGSLLLLVLAIAGTPLVMQLINGIILFRIQRPWLFPRWSAVTSPISRELLSAGISFFLLQVAVAVSYSSDNLVLVRILGPEAVAQYSIPAKLFNLAALVCSMLIGSLWPAYGEALAKNDVSWIRRTFRRSLWISIAVSVPTSVFLIGLGRPIIHAWVGPHINPSRSLLFGLGIWCVLASISGTVATLLNGLSVLSFQVKLAVVTAIANITLSVYLTKRIGIPGVIYGSIITQAVIVLIPYAIFLYRYFRTELELSKR